MAKLPSFQFYPGDWLKDPALRMCSPAARGVWIDMLCLLYECPQRGVFRSKNERKMNAISIKKISNSIAGCKPKLIQELIGNGVVYIARKDGALYCKRFVRDELKRRHKAISGKKGGSKTQANPKQTPSKPEAKPQANPGSSSSTSSSTSVINKYCPNSHEFRLSKLLLDLMLERKPDYKKPNLQSWSKHIDQMIRLDKRTPEKIEAVIQWSQKDTFWQNNILSTKKLRDQFDQLEIKMRGKQNAANSNQRNRSFDSQKSSYGEQVQM